MNRNRTRFAPMMDSLETKKLMSLAPVVTLLAVHKPVAVPSAIAHFSGTFSETSTSATSSPVSISLDDLSDSGDDIPYTGDPDNDPGTGDVPYYVSPNLPDPFEQIGDSDAASGETGSSGGSSSNSGSGSSSNTAALNAIDAALNGINSVLKGKTSIGSFISTATNDVNGLVQNANLYNPGHPSQQIGAPGPSSTMDVVPVNPFQQWLTNERDKGLEM